VRVNLEKAKVFAMCRVCLERVYRHCKEVAREL
jgi:hypothetical protein